MQRRLTLFIFIQLVLIFKTYAQDCTTLKEITWPDELIYSYFKSPGSKIILLPSYICKTKGDLEIKNTANQTLGTFKIKESVKSKYNDNILKSKSTPKIVLDYHSKITESLNPYVFTDFIFKFFKKRFYLENKNELQFLRGDFTLKKKTLSWNPYFYTQTHWNAKNIGYKELLQMYLKPNVVYISLKEDDGYFFPKATEFTEPLAKFSKTELANLILENNPSLEMEDNDIVIFSTYKNSIRAYNLISKMFLKNSKKVHWFNNADTEWASPNQKKLVDRLKNPKLSKPDDFIATLNSGSDFKILDSSDEEQYSVVSYLNSIELKPKRLSASEYKNYFLKFNSEEAYKGLKDTYKKEGSYIIYGTEKIPKNVKVFFVGDHSINSIKAADIYNLLLKTGFTNLYLVESPIGEIYQYVQDKNIDPKKIFSFTDSNELLLGDFSSLKIN